MTITSNNRSDESKLQSATTKESKFVIYPDNKWINIWDGVILTLLFLLAFIIPYQIGVSAGYYFLTNIWWFVCLVLMNTLFVIDTILYFWRAYYRDDENNHRLVIDLRKIRRRYLRTYFIPNLISNFPSTVIFYAYVRQNLITNTPIESNQMVIFIKVTELFKLFRFFRVKAVLQSSQTVTYVKQTVNNQGLMLIKYVALLVFVSHWFACLWSAVALYEAGGTSVDKFLGTTNWIGNWYESSYVEGGLDPLGPDRHFDRYVLSLFWSIQTITSIGYGNIAPITRTEWFFGCFLMMLSGIMWAYLIGGLVTIASAFNEQNDIYARRNDAANQMIKHFVIDDDDNDDDANNSKTHNKNLSNRTYGTVLKRNIKQFIHDQSVMSERIGCVNSIGQSFPIFDTLSPTLQRMSSYMLLYKVLEKIPYLSSRFLTVEEQSIIARDCLFMEFSTGDVFDFEEGVSSGTVDEQRRGVFVVMRGTAFGFDCFRSILLMTNATMGAEWVLLEDDHPAIRGRIRFLSYSKVVFIPRTVVLRALERNSRAWKDCARWIYLRTLLRSHSLSIIPKKN